MIPFAVNDLKVIRIVWWREEVRVRDFIEWFCTFCLSSRALGRDCRCSYQNKPARHHGLASAESSRQGAGGVYGSVLRKIPELTSITFLKLSYFFLN